MKNITKYISIALLSIVAIIIASCSNNDNEKTYWVNSYKTDCVGVAPTTCLLVQKGDTLKEEAWTNFYDNIEGFNYLPGYIYKLKVLESKKEGDIPADASSISYSLIKVIDKEIDSRLRLTDIWVLEQLFDKSVSFYNSDNEMLKTPYIEIKVSSKTIHGNDGCNNFRGNIGIITKSKITILETMGTKMMCGSMELVDIFNEAIAAVNYYEIGDNKLQLKNIEGKTIMIFKKVD